VNHVPAVRTVTRALQVPHLSPEAMTRRFAAVGSALVPTQEILDGPPSRLAVLVERPGRAVGLWEDAAA